MEKFHWRVSIELYSGNNQPRIPTQIEVIEAIHPGKAIDIFRAKLNIDWVSIAELHVERAEIIKQRKKKWLAICIDKRL